MDDWLMGWVATHRARVVTDVARAAMDGAGSLRLLAVAAVAAAALVVICRAYRAAVAGVASAVSAVVVAGVLKHVIGRARPPASLSLVELGGAAMPSTHASWTAAASLAVLLVAARHAPAGVRAALFALATAGNVLVGVLMVYLGAHWPSDVLAGWALGAVVGAVVARVLGRRQSSRGSAPVTALDPAR